MHMDALRRRAAEAAVVLSRLSALLRTTNALALPTAAERPGVMAERRLVLSVPPPPATHTATAEDAETSSFDVPSNSHLPSRSQQTPPVVVSVPSFAAREALRAARKRLRGEENDVAGFDTLSSFEGWGGGEGEVCGGGSLSSSSSFYSSRIFPIMRPVTLTEGLQKLMGPRAGAANPAASPNVVVRRGRRSEFNTILGASGTSSAATTAEGATAEGGAQATDATDDDASERPPSLGHAIRFLQRTQSAERSALLRFGTIPSLMPPSALPQQSTTNSSSILSSIGGGSGNGGGGGGGPAAAAMALAADVAASEYDRLQRTAEAFLTAEYLTLVTRRQLEEDLPKIIARLGGEPSSSSSSSFPTSPTTHSPSSSSFVTATAASPLVSPAFPLVTVLRVSGGVAALSLRGMCVISVCYSEQRRRWALVGFMWTLFDVSGVRGAAASAAESPPSDNATDGKAVEKGGEEEEVGTALSLVHYSHQQIQKRIAAEVDASLLSGIAAALRCCSAAVLQHLHNRLVPLGGGGPAATTPPFAVDGYLCRSRTDACRNGSITLFCYPQQQQQQAAAAKEEEGGAPSSQQQSAVASPPPMTTVRIYYDHRSASLLKGTLVGTNTDAERRRGALEVVFLLSKEVASASASAPLPTAEGSASQPQPQSQQQRRLMDAIEHHVIANMAMMAGLPNVPSEREVVGAPAGSAAATAWAAVKAALPPVAGTPVALFSLAKLISPL